MDVCSAKREQLCSIIDSGTSSEAGTLWLQYKRCKYSCPAQAVIIIMIAATTITSTTTTITTADGQWQLRPNTIQLQMDGQFHTMRNFI